MSHLTPVRRDHVRRRRQPRPPPELGHHFPARVAIFGSARILRISQHVVLIATECNRFAQAPGTIRIQRDAGFGETLCQRGHSLNFGLAAENTTLELEVIEPVQLLRGFRQTDHGFGRQRFFVPQPEPVIGSLGLAAIRKVGFRPIAHIKQIAESLHLFPLLALAEERRHGHLQMLAEQIQQRSFERSHSVDSRPKIERLVASAPGIAIRELAAH